MWRSIGKLCLQMPHSTPKPTWFMVYVSTSGSDGHGVTNTVETEEPSTPVTCCGSGCQNCVWIEYAERLLDFYKHKYADSEAGLKRALAEIDKIEDENLKTFVRMELGIRLKNFKR